ncbi:Proteinase inhibitor, propeptide [Ascosphaera apis ARSEF 7405]|uniref:Proteinase inhibitor, propeptide n=1 Tax=Ascosphaera apis ARSEF 7405 TaxID=392613 RepID=A0A168CVS0_9EURO|nr:Proteinase inhibitor, propeptide [Ascosphaera apis ARSEF 7405]
MKFFGFGLLLCLYAQLLTVLGSPQGAEEENVVISYPDDTPSSLLQQAMDMITDAGGIITHEYSIIRGFAAVAPEYVLSSITTLSPDFQPVIEQDGVVSINDSHDWSEEEDEADAEEDEEFYLEDLPGIMKTMQRHDDNAEVVYDTEAVTAGHS